MSRMALETAIRLSAEVKGGANITKVQRSLQDLAKGSQTTARDMDALRTATAQYARASEGSIAGIRNSIVAFRGLQEQAKIGSREFTRYGAEVQRLERNLRGLEGTARKASPALNGLGAAAGRLLAAYAGIETVRFVFGNTAELEAQTRSLEVLTGSADRAKQIVQELQQLGAVTPFTSTELIDTAKRLQAFGVETEKVVDITRRLADVSGATGAELAGLATAYGQVQAKGRLQGEELLQFQERGVALQQVLRKEYGLSAAEFQKALEGGKISAEAVEFALRKLTDSGGKYANGAIAQSDTLKGRLSTLSDSVQVLAQTIGNSLAPVFKWALTQATAVVSEIQRMIDEANNAGGARDREAQFARNADAAVRSMGLNPFTQQGMMAEMRQRNIEQQRADYRLSQQIARVTNAAPPSTAPPPLSGAGAAAGGAGDRKDGVTRVEVVIGGLTGGGQADASRGRSTGPHLHAKRVSGRGVNEQIAAALEFPGGKTALNYGERRRPGYHDGYAGNDYGTPQGTPFRLRPGWKATDMGTKGALGRGMRVSGPLGTFELGHLAGVNKGTRAEADPFEAASGAVRAAEDAAKKEEERRKARENGLLTSARQLAILERQADVARAITSEEKITASSDLARTERMYKFIDLLKEAQSDEQRMNVLKQQGLEIQSAQVDLAKQYGDVIVAAAQKQEAAIRPLQDEIDRLEATFKGPAAVKALERRNAVGSMAAAGVDPAKAGALFDEIEALKARISKQQELNDLVNEGGQAMQGFLDSMIRGTESWQESLAGLVESLGKVLLQAGLSALAGKDGVGLFSILAGSFGKSFAGGGYTGSSPRAGGIDGQGGFPAILHPQETVIDHTRMMPVPYQSSPAAATGEMAVPYQGASAAGATSGLTVPYQSSGTTLAVPFLKGGGGDGSAASMPLDNEPIRYESRIVDGVETVTKEQAEEIGRRTEQRVLKRLQNSPTTRRAAGIR